MKKRLVLSVSLVALVVLLVTITASVAMAKPSQYGAQSYSEPANRIKNTGHSLTKDPVTGLGQDTKFCPLCGGDAKTNWYNCGKCHVGGAPGGDTTREPVIMAESGTSGIVANVTVDCGVCHNLNYDMNQRVYSSTLGKWDYNAADIGDARKWTINQNATELNAICYRCHTIGLDMKRGTPFKTGEDHHVSKGLSCLSCHPMESVKVKNDCSACHPKINHKFSRGLTHQDVSVNDMPKTDVTCLGSCHSISRHTDIDGKSGPFTMSAHARLECQVCHTPSVDGVVYRRYTTGLNFVQFINADTLPWQEVKATDPGDGSVHMVVPYTFKWFSGNQDAEGHAIFTSRSDPGAKLSPVKDVKTVMTDGSTVFYKVQPSHGIKSKTSALRDCNFCHVTHKADLGL